MVLVVLDDKRMMNMTSVVMDRTIMKMMKKRKKSVGRMLSMGKVDDEKFSTFGLSRG